MIHLDIILLSIEMKKITYGSKDVEETRTRHFLAKTWQEAVKKISNYTHHELTEEQEAQALYDLSHLRVYSQSSEEIEEKILVLVEDHMEIII